MRSITSAFLSFSMLIAVLAAPLASATAPQGMHIVVVSTADSGPGTLRQALLDAQAGDTITFDDLVFPPTAPVTISLVSELPGIHAGDLTIDASDAGVVLDGTNVTADWAGGLVIVNSDGNTIRGLQISNFSGRAIDISGDSEDNVIGGDRSDGAGPFGQGNMLTHNGNGIVLSTGGTSLNVITGNIIGTDVAGATDLGNGTGIWIVEGANGNTIGPDNIIAHNDGPGIAVYDAGTLHNTFTQNSIHHNTGPGILVWSGGNGELVPPIIFHFDLETGSVSGTTCANCIVEVFSDSGYEGETSEGQVTADQGGHFTFDRGGPFLGPRLTATATDADGNTSGFSVPTFGAAGSLIMQDGNELPVAQFHPKHSGDLVDNRIGVYFHGFNIGERFDLSIYSLGVKRARAAINALDAELVDWDSGERPEDYVCPSYDDVFTRMADEGLTTTYVLTFWDKATYPGGEGAPCPRFKTEEEIEHYLEFVQFIVNHFKDRVEYYELWNEPDIRDYCPQWIEVEDYINLVERVVPVIREEYPEAKIQVGGVSGIRYPEAYEYLLALLESEVLPLVDVVSWHPFYGESPGCEPAYYYDYPSTVQEIKNVAAVHGFEGEYEADELTWWTPDTAAPGQPCVDSPTVAGKYYGRSMLMHLGMDVGVTLGGGPGNAGRNLCTIMAGAEPGGLPVQIQTTVTNTVSYTFSLPGDDHLVALWTNGIAAEYDPGITATVTISGCTDCTVRGIDVLHGFEQPIVARKQNGSLVVEDLLVKDYPVIIRLNSPNDVYLPLVLNEQSP